MKLAHLTFIAGMTLLCISVCSVGATYILTGAADHDAEMSASDAFETLQRNEAITGSIYEIKLDLAKIAVAASDHDDQSAIFNHRLEVDLQRSRRFAEAAGTNELVERLDAFKDAWATEKFDRASARNDALTIDALMTSVDEMLAAIRSINDEIRVQFRISQMTAFTLSQLADMVDRASHAAAAAGLLALIIFRVHQVKNTNII